ncbi:MAG TPA: uroporphyrinogen-III C-methyltransferase [Streptosporangiaceae bacterium]|nr:uroporphyrinogen-III C-methyltransferase [Streptosporangiaceae bacterium]
MADGRPYLLGLRLSGRRVLVAGGGAVAGRRVPALLDAGADVLLVSPEVTVSLEDLAQSGRIQWERRRFAPGDTDGAWLVCACTDDAAVNEAITAEADEHRIWSVRADHAQDSSVWTPAAGQAGDVQVGVLSGDPRHSAGLRDAIVTGLQTGTVGARRGRQHHSGVALVGGGPGDPGLITVRGRQLLAEADVVVTDRLAPRSVLDELPPDVEVIDVAKIPYGRSVAQEHINATLVEHAQAGKFVVRLKGGDPYVFGRGAEEAIACLRAGVEVMVVPGITSAIAVPGVAHVPVTHRGVAQEFTVVSVHVPPDDPRSTVNWPALGATRGTLILLMAVERLAAVAATLIGHGRSASTPVSVIADGTLPTQRTIVATLDTVAPRVMEDGIRPPAVVVIGEVVNVAAEITELMRAMPRSEPGQPGARPARAGTNGTGPA